MKVLISISGSIPKGFRRYVYTGKDNLEVENAEHYTTLIHGMEFLLGKYRGKPCLLDLEDTSMRFILSKDVEAKVLKNSGPLGLRPAEVSNPDDMLDVPELPKGLEATVGKGVVSIPSHFKTRPLRAEMLELRIKLPFPERDSVGRGKGAYRYYEKSISSKMIVDMTEWLGYLKFLDPDVKIVTERRVISKNNYRSVEFETQVRSKKVYGSYKFEHDGGHGYLSFPIKEVVKEDDSEVAVVDVPVIQNGHKVKRISI